MYASLITYSIKVPSKMIKNDRRFTIHIISTVQKMLRTCTDKQMLKEYLSKSPCRLISSMYSTVVCLQHQP